MDNQVLIVVLWLTIWSIKDSKHMLNEAELCELHSQLQFFLC